MYYLWMKQKGEGCDYMIGCGEKVVPLNATGTVALSTEVLATLDYYGIDDNERCLADCKVLADTVLPCSDMLAQHLASKQAERDEYETKAKREKLAQLAAELGVKVSK